MALKVKTIKGRGYWYVDTTTRVNGKPVTKSKYLGPVHPKRKKGILGQLLAGGVQVAAWAVVGKLGPPGGKAYKEKYRAPDPRSEPNDKMRALHARWEQEDAQQRWENREYGAPNSPQTRQAMKDFEVLKARVDAQRASTQHPPPAQPAAPSQSDDGQAPAAASPSEHEQPSEQSSDAAASSASSSET